LTSQAGLIETIKAALASGQIVLPVKPGKTTRCEHNYQANRCWLCNPSKDPKKATCKDCTKTGHFSKNSPRCSLFMKVQGHAAPGGPNQPLTNDDDPWSKESRQTTPGANIIFAGSATNENKRPRVHDDVQETDIWSYHRKDDHNA
jgi:hypothetical protein